MFILVTILHVIACLVLIAVILLQSGRGGGLSEMLGGGMQQTQKIFGTQTTSFMSKATSYCAITFLVTSIVLGVMTSHRSRSLLAGAEIQPFFDTTTQAPAPLLPDVPETSSGADAATAATATQPVGDQTVKTVDNTVGADSSVAVGLVLPETDDLIGDIR